MKKQITMNPLRSAWNLKHSGAKRTVLKLLYILLGWSAVIFLGMLAWFLLDQNFLCDYWNGVEVMEISGNGISMMYIVIAFILPLLPMYILIFSNQLCLNFLESLGIFNLFLIAEGIAVTIACSASIMLMYMFPVSFLCTITWTGDADWFTLWTISSFLQILIIYPLFMLIYWVWIRLLKSRKFCTYIPRKIRFSLYFTALLNPCFVAEGSFVLFDRLKYLKHSFDYLIQIIS